MAKPEIWKNVIFWPKSIIFRLILIFFISFLAIRASKIWKIAFFEKGACRIDVFRVLFFKKWTYFTSICTGGSQNVSKKWIVFFFPKSVKFRQFWRPVHRFVQVFLTVLFSKSVIFDFTKKWKHEKRKNTVFFGQKWPVFFRFFF